MGIAPGQLDLGLLRSVKSLPIMNRMEALGLVQSDWHPILALIAGVINRTGGRAQPLVLHLVTNFDLESRYGDFGLSRT